MVRTNTDIDFIDWQRMKWTLIKQVSTDIFYLKSVNVLTRYDTFKIGYPIGMDTN